MGRLGWDQYFIKLAYQVATRSTCDRLSVGTVIVRDNVILSTGYNGAPRGMPHCDDVGHLLENGHCKRVVHSEVNAVAQAARYGIAIDEAIVYTIYYPCFECMKVLINAGIKEVRYHKIYENAVLRQTVTPIKTKQVNLSEEDSKCF